MVQRNYARILILVACGIALTFGLSGCKDEPEQKDVPEIEGPNDEIAVEVGTTDEPPTTTPTLPKTNDVTPPPPPPVTVDDQLQPIPGVGLGKVKFGMAKEQVTALLGEPDRIEAGGMALYYLRSKGLQILIDPGRGVRAIDCWSKDYPNAPHEMTTFAGKTEEGIGIGATREQIVAAYGEPDRTDTRPPFETLRYTKLRTHFVLTQNGLVNLKLLAP
ncbi:MAG: hypothetical protein ACYSUC_11235 [Planctomycetota bacterium]|jgi:hypothetical protein